MTATAMTTRRSATTSPTCTPSVSQIAGGDRSHDDATPDTRPLVLVTTPHGHGRRRRHVRPGARVGARPSRGRGADAGLAPAHPAGTRRRLPDRQHGRLRRLLFDSPLAHDFPTSHLSFRCDEDGDEEGEGATEDAAPGGGLCRRGRAGKKARMVWTPELHHRFVDAVARLGDKGAVPKAIVQVMNVEGLTRENVASHLQKYRLYLKRTRTAAAASSVPSAGIRLPLQPPTASQHLEPERLLRLPLRVSGDYEKLERD